MGDRVDESGQRIGLGLPIQTQGHNVLHKRMRIRVVPLDDDLLDRQRHHDKIGLADVVTFERGR